MITVSDDVGRQVELARPARRVVSLVPSLTETVCVLGRGATLVGATRYCTEPASALQGVARVGGTKNPNLAQIRALQPDLVLLNAEENRRQDFEALRAAGLTLFVAFPRRVRDTLHLIERLGVLTAGRRRAQRLVEELRRSVAECAAAGGVQRLRVFCPIWKNPWMSFNQDTYCSDMLWVAGGLNVCGPRADRFCAVALEEIAGMLPDVILLPDEPYVFKPRDLVALAPLRSTPAWREKRVHFIDGKALSWYGPRTAPGLRSLRQLLRHAG